jgi:hypothetical protein
MTLNITFPKWFKTNALYEVYYETPDYTENGLVGFYSNRDRREFIAKDTYNAIKPLLRDVIESYNITINDSSSINFEHYSSKVHLVYEDSEVSFNVGILYLSETLNETVLRYDRFIRYHKLYDKFDKFNKTYGKLDE